MYELYFFPMACSLASRIVLTEANIEATFHQIDPVSKVVISSGENFCAISPKAKVPALRLPDKKLLTESAAVLQYLGQLNMEKKLLPFPGSWGHYCLIEWLNFIGTELHKSYLYPTFNKCAPQGERLVVLENLHSNLKLVEHQLSGNEFLLSSHFSVADAYLIWALVLMQYSGIDFSGMPHTSRYINKLSQRKSVRESIKLERALL